MRSVGLSVLIALGAIAACSDSNAPDNGNPFIDGSLTANVSGSGGGGGAGFAGNTRVTATLVTGTLIVEAVQVSGGITSGIMIDLDGVSGAGTFNIGFGNPGNVATYVEATETTAGTWGATVNGGSGQVVIGHLTPTHIAGTFTFMANALLGSATGTKTVSSGTFSIELSAPEGQAP